MKIYMADHGLEKIINQMNHDEKNTRHNALLCLYNIAQNRRITRI